MSVEGDVSSRPTSTHLFLFMKLRSALLGLLLASTTFSLLAEEPAKAPVKETELEQKMDVIGGAFRKLRRQISDPAKAEDSLKLVMQIKEAAAASVKLTPEKAADVPEAERAKYVADYQAKMKDFLGEVEKLQVAVTSGKLDEATKILGQMNALQKSGHKEFRKPDKRE